MAAGLGFKDFATGEVLTAADVDGYLMQGVWVFASATARDAAVTSPQEGNFAFLKDTNVTTYYTGSAWANLDTTGMTNPMTTTGDTIYSSSGSTPARLGIGTAGQVLQVNSGATAPEWATPASGGGMTLISTTSLSGTTGATLSSIAGTFNSLQIIVFGAAWDTANDILTFKPNGNNATFHFGGQQNTTNYNRTNGTGEITTFNWLRTDTDNVVVINWDNYASSSSNKPFNFYGYCVNATSSVATSIFGGGVWKTTTAISSFTIDAGGNNFTGGTVLLYGVK
jgi:hypothetical protein